MHQLDHLGHILIKETERVWVGEHYAGQALVAKGFEGYQIHVSTRVRWQMHNLKPAHRGRGGVGAVRGVRDKDAGALSITAVGVVFLDDEHAGQLAVRASCGLQGDARKTNDFLQPLLQCVHQVQVALHRVFRL